MSTRNKLERIEERMSKRLDDHGNSFSLLHEAQMHLDQNTKMIMTKIGVTPVNTSPPSPPLREQTLTYDSPQEKIGGDLTNLMWRL